MDGMFDWAQLRYHVLKTVEILVFHLSLWYKYIYNSFEKCDKVQ